jgi:cobalt/nickel transport system ATP-binding protein
MYPTILVMDEPTSNLDPQARRRLIELLKTFEQTIIIATHDLDMAFDLCARTIVVREGGILADGPSREILQDAALLAAGHLERPLRLQGCPVCSPRLASAGRNAVASSLRPAVDVRAADATSGR